MECRYCNETIGESQYDDFSFGFCSLDCETNYGIEQEEAKRARVARRLMLLSGLVVWLVLGVACLTGAFALAGLLS